MRLTRHATPAAFSRGICGEDAKKPRKVTMASKMNCFPNSLRLSPEVVPIQTMVISSTFKTEQLPDQHSMFRTTARGTRLRNDPLGHGFLKLLDDISDNADLGPAVPPLFYVFRHFKQSYRHPACRFLSMLDDLFRRFPSVFD